MSLPHLISLIALGAIWGASFLFIRIAAPALGAFPVAGGRVVIAAVVLTALLRLLGQRPALRAHARELLVLGAINAAIPFALISAAEVHVTASLAAMLNATIPFWGTSAGVVWLGERAGTRRIVGLLLGLVGIVAIVGWSPIVWSRATVLAVIAMLVACCSYVAGGIYARRRLAHVAPPTLALGQQVAAAAWLVGPALLQAPSARVEAGPLLALLALGVVCTAGAYLLFFRLLAAIGPTRTTTVAYLFPMFGALWGALFLGERVTGGMVLGFAVVLASVLLVNEVRLPRLSLLRRTSAPEARRAA